MFTSMPVGCIFGVIGVFNSFGDYTELNIYPIASWAKLCDGTVINDPDSPMNGSYVPDILNSVIVGDTVAGSIFPARSIGGYIYCFGEYNPQQTLSNSENILTVKYFMRIK